MTDIHAKEFGIGNSDDAGPVSLSSFAYHAGLHLLAQFAHNQSGFASKAICPQRCTMPIRLSHKQDMGWLSYIFGYGCTSGMAGLAMLKCIRLELREPLLLRAHRLSTIPPGSVRALSNHIVTPVQGLCH